MDEKEKQDQKQEATGPKMVTVFVPVDPSVEEDKETHLLVGVNGQMYQVERGVDVEVPEAVANIIRYSKEAEAEAKKYRAAAMAKAKKKDA